MPKPGGNGLAMRAAMLLDALAREFAVDLFVYPVAGAAEPASAYTRERAARIGTADPDGFLDTHAALIERIRDPEQRLAAALAYPRPLLTRCCTAPAALQLAEWATGGYAVLHVMRLYLAPLVEPFLRAAIRPRIVFDLDDDDAAYQEGLAALCHAAGDRAGGLAASAEAEKYRALAARSLPGSDLCLTAAEIDRDRLARLFPAVRFRTVPNGYPSVEPPTPPSPPGEELRLLFVGTLGYPPNADAAALLIRDILPLLQRRSSVRVRLDIVGAGAPQSLTRLARDPAVILHGFVEELAPLYAAADIVVAPLRFGGGTPIKLLEAFAYRRPVVATKFAAAGLEIIDGEHLLLAEDAEGFAAACLRMRDETGRAQGCIDRAAALLRARYHPERVADAVGEAYAVLHLG